MKPDIVKIINIVLDGNLIIGLGDDGIVYTWVPATATWKLYGVEPESGMEAHIVIAEGMRIVSITLNGSMVIGLGDNSTVHAWTPSTAKWQIYGVPGELKERFLKKQLFGQPGPQ